MTGLKALVGRVKARLRPHRSTWVQDVLALTTVAAVIILAALQMPIPEILSGIAWVIIGYFFGTLQGQPVTGAVESVEERSKVRRTRHGRGRGKLIHFQCVEREGEGSA